MRNLLASILLLLPAAALAAPPPPATPAASAAPEVSVTTPAATVTVNVPAVSVKIRRVQKDDSGATAALSGTVPVPARVTNLDLQARVGQVHIRTADTDRIQVKVHATSGGEGHFIFHWTTGTSSGSAEAGGLPKDLHLVTQRNGNTMALCLTADTSRHECNHSGVEGSGWKADWELVVPARLHLELHGGVISGTVRGVAGGVTAHVGVGKLQLALPRGPVTARVGVGKLEVRVASPDYGSVHLTAGVGNTHFQVGDRTIKAGYRHEFTSSGQETTGPGTTTYDLKAGTGEVTLHLGVSNPGKGMGEHDE